MRCWCHGGTQSGGHQSGRETDGAGGCGAGKDAAEGWSEPRASGEGAKELERARANELGKRGTGADAAERRGAGVNKFLMGAAVAGAHEAGRGAGADDPGIGLPKAIVG